MTAEQLVVVKAAWGCEAGRHGPFPAALAQLGRRGCQHLYDVICDASLGLYTHTDKFTQLPKSELQPHLVEKCQAQILLKGMLPNAQTLPFPTPWGMLLCSQGDDLFLPALQMQWHGSTLSDPVAYYPSEPLLCTCVVEGSKETRYHLSGQRTAFSLKQSHLASPWQSRA